MVAPRKHLENVHVVGVGRGSVFIHDQWGGSCEGQLLSAHYPSLGAGNLSPWS